MKLDMTKELIVTLYISYPPKVHIYNNGLGLSPQNLTHNRDLYLSALGTGITLLFLLKPAALAQVRKTIFLYIFYATPQAPAPWKTDKQTQGSNQRLELP